MGTVHSTKQAKTEHDLKVLQEAGHLRQIAERALDGAKATVSMLEDVVESAQRLDQLAQGEDPTRRTMTAEQFMGAWLANEFKDDVVRVAWGDGLSPPVSSVAPAGSFKVFVAFEDDWVDDNYERDDKLTLDLGAF